MPWWHTLEVQITAFAGAICVLCTWPWILMTKKDSTSAVAWCLIVFFLPFVGTLLFLIFGWQHVHRPLKRKRKHKRLFHLAHTEIAVRSPPTATAFPALEPEDQSMAQLAQRFGGFVPSAGNDVVLFHDGRLAMDAILQAIQGAKLFVHLEYFILQPDVCGSEIIRLLAEKAGQGVEVRLLYDAMGSRRLHRKSLRILQQAGGRFSEFLPLNPFRRRIQVNMRNHRKIIVVDGTVAFTGGLNIGDEYLGLNPRYGYWRDTHLQISGPAVNDLHRVFVEDWDFAADEDLQKPDYFPRHEASGRYPVQVVASGPDQEINSVREIYFAAILRARRRLWIASPYFVPDAGLRDALCLAGYQGVDVRLLGQHYPDKWIPYYAARYYWADMLAAGVKVYQYARGMMHSKVVIVDGAWASVGTANLDNRSLHLNFEVNCMIYDRAIAAELEQAFADDLGLAIRLRNDVYGRRPLPGRVIENACRLLSPIL
jgi:cardiolipin synthase